ncbi:hypothetical protein [Longispora albida]|uniref:hypothetical protein n=1 Tax=Longispora albida TaxID=203523 RepID=UPI00037B88A2|nr:hypothetical protein [Longispora albida]
MRKIRIAVFALLAVAALGTLTAAATAGPASHEAGSIPRQCGNCWGNGDREL